MHFHDLNPDQLEKAANMLKAIVHPVRIFIPGLLEEGNKMSVTGIYESMNIEQSNASHHPGLLRDRDVLSSKKEGKTTMYFLKHKDLASIIDCVSNCC